MSLVFHTPPCGLHLDTLQVWGVGVLYVLSFPILLTMLVVGALKVTEETAEGENEDTALFSSKVKWMTNVPPRLGHQRRRIPSALQSPGCRGCW